MTSSPMKAILSEQKQAEKLAKQAYKSYRRLVKKELVKTFGIRSMLDFAMKSDKLHELNLSGFINVVYTDVMSSILDKKNVETKLLKEAQVLFSERVKASSTIPDELQSKIVERMLDPGKIRRKEKTARKGDSEKSDKKAKKEAKTKTKDKPSRKNADKSSTVDNQVALT